MAIDTDPSIFRDRGSIGSTEELDEYGVWVKVEPQDLNNNDTGLTMGAIPDTDEIEDVPDMDLGIEDDQEALSLSETEVEATTASGDRMEDITSDEALPSFDDIDMFDSNESSSGEQDEATDSEDDIFADIASLSDEETVDSSRSASVAFSLDGDSIESEDIPDIDFNSIDEEEAVNESSEIALEENPVEIMEEEMTKDTIDFESDDTESVDLDDFVTEEEKTDSTEATQEPGDFSEISMDDFLDGGEFSTSPDIPLEASSFEGTSDEDDSLDMDLEFNDAPQAEVSFKEDEIEDFDFDSIVDESEVDLSNTTNIDVSMEDVEIETVSDFDDFLNELSDTDTPSQESTGSNDSEDSTSNSDDIDIFVDESETVDNGEAANAAAESIQSSDFEVSLDPDEEMVESSEDDVSFDDLGALRGDLEAVDQRIESTAEQVTSTDSGLSTQLLMRIADELSSIKTEIASLKGELSILRAKVPVQNGEDSEENTPGGFFDEEEDEKIALTGDELDNILNTADFTEESGDSEFADDITPEVIQDTLSDFEDKGSEDINAFLVDKDDILSDETSEMTSETIEEAAIEDSENGIEEILIEEESSNDSLESLNLQDDDEIARLMDEGVQPMTEAPEDTTYLESDEMPLVEEIDLENAVIDEPDFGDVVLEDSIVEEPILDSIDFSLADEDEETLHVESREDTILEEDIPTEDISFEDSYSDTDEVLSTDDLLADETNELTEAVETSLEENNIETAQTDSFKDIVPEDFSIQEETILSSDDIIEEDVESFQEASDEEVEVPDELSNIQDAPEDSTDTDTAELNGNLKQEVKAVLSYMDQLLESLPEDKIEEFAQSEYFETYKKLFEELGLS